MLRILAETKIPNGPIIRLVKYGDMDSGENWYVNVESQYGAYEEGPFDSFDEGIDSYNNNFRYLVRKF